MNSTPQAQRTWKSTMSAVMTVRFVTSRSLARRCMNSRCVALLLTAVMLLLGKACAMNRLRLPQPQPSSSTDWPSTSLARAQYSAAVDGGIEGAGRAGEK
eukprot:GHRQ01037142.1.p2 GENE.GHRQ01037142.1~~GHRQ01037142.1.p2  ORF type:complete len:100 (+),score=15.65 GHRQ01037142.1:236-535(+)